MASNQFPAPDLMDSVEERGSAGYVYVISSVAAVGGLLFGFDTAIISGAIEFIRGEFALDPHLEGFAVSSLLVGCFAGAGVAGLLSDRLGRKKVLIGTAAMYVVSAILAALPHSLTALVMARFLGGVAVGVSSVVSPMYIAEVSPARIRGGLVTLNQMAIVTGILLAYVVSSLLVHADNNWRWMFASAALPAALLFIALFGVPESPRWLAKQGDQRRALAVLARVGGRGHAQRELQEINEALGQEEGSLGELLQPGLRVALSIGVVLAILGQISGINTVIYYAPKIFLKAGFAEASSALWATVLVGITNFVVTIASLVVVDRLGRKPLLMIGTAGMALAMILAGFCMTDPGVPMSIKVLIILIYIAGFGVGVGGVVWVVISEIFPTKIRGRAVSIAVMSVWAACFAIAQTFPYLLARFEERVFWIYGSLSAVMCLFVMLVVPETKGKSLEEIERMWRRMKS